MVHADISGTRHAWKLSAAQTPMHVLDILGSESKFCKHCIHGNFHLNIVPGSQTSLTRSWCLTDWLGRLQIHTVCHPQDHVCDHQLSAPGISGICNCSGQHLASHECNGIGHSQSNARAKLWVWQPGIGTKPTSMRWASSFMFSRIPSRSYVTLSRSLQNIDLRFKILCKLIAAG